VGAGSSDAFLTKTDAFGTVQWTKTYGDSAYEVAYAVRQTSDGGFIVVGETESVGNGLGDIWIFKTNSTGTVSWQRTCGGSGGDAGNDIIQTLDGGYAVAGFQNNPSAGNDNACLLKMDGSGNIQWVHTYSAGTNDDYGYSVAQTTGGGYILAGESIDNVNFVSNALIVRTDASGTLQGASTYGTINDHWINSIIAQPSGNIVVAGVSSEVSTLNVWLAQLNPNGVPVWSNSYAGGGSNSDIALSVASTPDGGFAVCGKTNSFSVDDAAFLMKTDSTGAPEWSKTYGGNANDRANQVITSMNGGYAIAANSLSFGSGQSGYFIKTDTNGTSGCNENIPSFLMTPETTPTSNVTVIDSSLTNVGAANNASLAQTITETQLCLTVGEKEVASAEDLISVYPNPGSEEFTIDNSPFTIKELEIYNSLGEQILKQQTTDNKRQTVNISSWNNGVYFLRIKTGSGFVVKKIVKQ
jgi:hypothetical protein